MPIAKVSGIDLYYEMQGPHTQGSPTQGSGAKVLFISGTGGDLRAHPNMFDGPLPQSHQVLSYDQRGLGQSSKPEVAYQMADYAADAAALLEHLQWPAVAVVGVSFGGMVAQELALRFPDKVQSLALCCTSSGGAGGASFPLHELAELTPQARTEQHLAVADLRRDASWREANPERWQKLLTLATQSVRGDRDEAGAARQLAARARHDTWDRLPQLQLPVGIFAGRYDGIAPMANQQALAEQISGAELHTYDGGHLFLAQDKSAYPDLLSWLHSNSSAN